MGDDLLGDREKVLVDGKAGAQGSGLGDRGDIYVDVGCADGGWVISKVLIKPLQVRPLLSLDQQFGQIWNGLKAHVPEKISARCG